MRRFIIYVTGFWIVAVVLFATILIDPAWSQNQLPQATDRPDQVVLDLSESVSIAAGTDYVSAPTEAARPFTHMLLRREAHVPEGAILELFVRASIDGTSWSDWGEVHANYDLWRETDGPDVAWSETVDVGAEARYWQVRGVFTAAPGGAMPELRNIDVNTVNTNVFGPDGPVEPTVDPQAAITAAVAKPPVVSRTAWGSADGQGSRVPPAYYPVNHMTVHHSADSNSLYPGQTNWAARVRAIWSFHTHTRGWGDVGYNYLIDPNGVVYEGRAGGDDAVGFHDTANYGSMGVVMIGTYSSVAPTGTSQDSLVKLLAWKASQKDIDPLGRSYYYGCANSRFCAPFNAGGIVDNIAGHRHVTPGHTTCPGDALVSVLPSIRNRVKQTMDGQGSTPPPNGEIVVDELEGGFARSNANWYSASCGAGGHTYYTYATDNPGDSTNSATWRPNIPNTGTYRVYVHVPQGCGLASPPYASTQARYTIVHAHGESTQTVDHNTATAWVDVGVYQFNQGTSGAVELYDVTGEPFDQQRVVFFDAVKWVPEDATSSIDLTDVRFENTTVASGELAKVTFTVKNTGSTPLTTQDPQAGTAPNGSFNDGQSGRIDDSYVYDEGECFLGNEEQTYATFAKESNRFRVTLGPTSGGDPVCTGNVGGYPWRWGINGELDPGESRDVTGYVRFHNYGTSNRTVNVHAGLIQEYVKYFEEGVNPTTITVTPEKVQPRAMGYDTNLNTVAHVYQLGNVPDNLLARTANSLSVPRGEYVGTIPWSGNFVDWGTGGPLGLTDQFLIEQTRVFRAPVDGEYIFRTTSDDGSWLWVNGTPVVLNSGLHPTKDVTGTIQLTAGDHTLSFKYFERSGVATAGYSVQIPGGTTFTTPLDPISNVLRLGNTFAEIPEVTIAADDLGGSGVERIRWSWDGVEWQDSTGSILRLGKIQNGSYRLQYQVFDKAGNQSDTYEVAFNVNTDMEIYQTYLPLTQR